MEDKLSSNEILKRLKERPELLDKIGKLFELEDKTDDFDLTAIELETLQLVKDIGAESLNKNIQAKEQQAFDCSKTKEKGRIHSKKN
jgi:hypothetical protein